MTFGHNASVCSSLDLPANEPVQNEVQAFVNNFKMVGAFAAAAPGVIYSLFAGALSDR